MRRPAPTVTAREYRVRVLHITTEFPPFVIGGLGIAVEGLASASARAGATVGVLLFIDETFANGHAPVERCVHGHQVSVQSAEHFEPAAADSEHAANGVTEITLFQLIDSGNSESDPPEVAVRIVEEWKPDLIHLHVVWELEYVRAILERFSLPIVYTVHSLLLAAFEIGREPAHILEYSREQATTITMANRVIALTRDEARLTGDYYPQARERLRIVGNGIDDSDTAHLAAHRVKRDEVSLVLYAGRLVERKGVREFLDAIPLILDRAPETRFVLAGGPVNLSSDEVEQQWLPASCIPFRSRISFTGWLSMEQLAEWYRAADVLVVPSRYEPFGMVILEGMLHGLSIAATDVGGPREILEHERTGLLFPPSDVEALADAVLRLVNDSQLRRTLGEAAAREVRAKWLWPRIIEQVHRIYSETLDEPPLWP